VADERARICAPISACVWGGKSGFVVGSRDVRVSVLVSPSSFRLHRNWTSAQRFSSQLSLVQSDESCCRPGRCCARCPVPTCGIGRVDNVCGAEFRHQTWGPYRNVQCSRRTVLSRNWRTVHHKGRSCHAGGLFTTEYAPRHAADIPSAQQLGAPSHDRLYASDRLVLRDLCCYGRNDIL